MAPYRHTYIFAYIKSEMRSVHSIILDDITVRRVHRKLVTLYKNGSSFLGIILMV